MNSKTALLLCVVLLCFVSFAQAQSSAGILPANRAIDWSQSGIPGGIPNRTTICSTLNAADYGNGTSDATTAIQNALNACPNNQVVSLSSGTFRINSSISIPSYRTLRGAGAQSTILTLNGSGRGAVYLGSVEPSLGATSTSITSGATAGSTTITVASTTGISVGTYLEITELNDPSFVTISTTNGTCTWCDGYWNGTRVRGQTVEVTSVNGNTVTFAPGLYSDYSHTPYASYFEAAAKYAGLENLQLYANNTGYTANIMMDSAAYSWVKGVESNYADGDHVRIFFGYRDEVRDSYFNNAFVHTSGTTDADVMLAYKSSGCLIINNILERLHAAVMLNWGAAGNVVAYNYEAGSYDSTATNVQMMNFSFHGAHPQFNLYEGNVAGKFEPDSFWGSSSDNTAFRNWLIGSSKIAPYTDGTYIGRKVIDWANAHWSFQANRAFPISYVATRYNLIGDVTGATDYGTALTLWHAGAAPCTACLVAPATRDYEYTMYPYTFGFDLTSDSTGSVSSTSNNAWTTALVHGDYDLGAATTAWTSGITQTLPASFFLSAKPGWWGSLPWPAIGPDVTGGPGPGGHAYGNPAEVCYNSTPRDPNGILLFNPNNCYTQSVALVPGPPTGLVAVVN